MKQFEITIKNVQNILDAINNNKFMNQKEIGNHIGLEQSRVSQIIINNINTKEEKIVFKKNGYYNATKTKAEEVPFIIIMKKMIEELNINPNIFFFSNKWLKCFFGLTPKEIDQFKAYAQDYLIEMNIKTSEK